MLALNEILAATGVKRLGSGDALCFRCAGSVGGELRGSRASPVLPNRVLGIEDNFAFAEVSDETLIAMVKVVAAHKPDAIGVICTNLPSARLVDALEREVGIPVYDTIATAVWKSLRLAGVDTTKIMGWGRLFQTVV